VVSVCTLPEVDASGARLRSKFGEQRRNALRAAIWIRFQHRGQDAH
jgi:hypothetical protein